MSFRPVLETPLRTAIGSDGRAVVIYLPSGGQIALSAAAAQASARSLAGSAVIVLECAAQSTSVVVGQFKPRHRLALRWQAWHRSLANQGLRLSVAGLLLPLAAALASIPGLLIIALAELDSISPLAFILAGLAILVIALPLAWCMAPLVMSPDERRSVHNLAKARLVLVSKPGIMLT